MLYFQKTAGALLVMHILILWYYSWLLVIITSFKIMKS